MNQESVTINQNTPNPFATLTSGALIKMILDSEHPEVKLNYWKEHSLGLITAIIGPLVWLRDKRGMRLDASVALEYTTLSRLLELRHMDEMPSILIEVLTHYCESLVGWDERKKAEQSGETYVQHSHLQMLAIKLLTRSGQTSQTDKQI